MEIDLSNLDAKTRSRVDEIFRTDFELKALKAIEQQTRRAALNHLYRPRSRDDFGPKTHEIHTFVDSIWRKLYGYNYSEDADLMKFLRRRNPEIVVKSLGTRIQSGWSPGAKSWFRKSYPEKEETKCKN